MPTQASKACTRKRLFKEQRGICFYCGEPMRLAKRWKNPAPNFATIDHIIPKSKGGQLAGNAVCACLKCNGERGDRDARLFMLEKQGVLA